jgi:NAD(P)-dependent dehydrogenase (short-subunit alcohol dehydrogenase family)
MKSIVKIYKAEHDKHNLIFARALVVGGTQGNGNGAAYVLANRGASVIIAGRNKELGEKVVSELN